MQRNSIPRVRAHGDAFSIGVALGRATAAGFRERVMRTEEYNALSGRWCGSDYLKALESAARASYPRYVREIEGIAVGAEQDFDSVFLWNCRGDLRLPEHVSPTTKAIAATGCTSLLVPAQQGRPAVVAHNDDGAAEFNGACVWVDAEPDDGLNWSSFMYPAMLPGHTFGANGAGLVQTVNNISSHDLKVGVPRQIICRAILDAKGMDDAVEILRRKDRASGYHHNLGEAATGRLVSVEAPASGCAVREVDTARAHANHLIFEEFRSLDQKITLSSRNRQQTADRLIAEGALDVGSEGVLFDETAPIYRVDRDCDDKIETLATGIFELFEDRVEWQVHATPKERKTLCGTIAVR
ncbi:C45 family peptidase [Mesorhizobium dulcispinae]|uniref:C45 family peptidase n=1 Tax=Mesorhizobium dulcispinae TaxID=3072316 RepID=UPI002A23D04E|nr:C45 family peptidase [Mesorhizobium sp. VK23D]MDX8522753.1 C45 family peptidase [Mesorhizobium sp. VK23D]